MKYTITSPETEARLAVVDHDECGASDVWHLHFFDEKNGEVKKTLNGVKVLFRDGILELHHSDPEGHREVYPALRNANDNTFIVATPLGNIRLLPSRGVALESASGAKSGTRAIKSSMPGKVLKLLCAVGDVITAGQPLLIIEAMKMENEIRSPQAGRIEEFGVQPGQSIQTGDLLVKLGKA